jgi:hypothetical protein
MLLNKKIAVSVPQAQDWTSATCPTSTPKGRTSGVAWKEYPSSGIVSAAFRRLFFTAV